MGAAARTGSWGGAVTLLLLVLLAPAPASGHGGSGPCPLDVMIVLDRSGSMDGAPGVAARAGAVTLLSALEGTDTSGLRGFSETMKDKGLDGDHAATIDAVNEDPPPVGVGTQYSATEAALEDIRADGRPVAEWVMVVLSDGRNADTSLVANEAKAEGVRIFSVAIGAFADRMHMEAVASDPKGVFYYEAADEAEARQAMETIHELLSDCRVEPELKVEPGCVGRTAVMRLDFSANPLATPESAHWSYSDGHPAKNASAQERVERDLNNAVIVTVHVTDQRGRVVHMNAKAAPLDCVPPEAVVVCQSSPATPQQVQVAARITAGDAPVASVAWEVDDTPVSTARSFMHTFPDDEPHTFRVTVVDESGQSDIAEAQCAAHGQDPPLLHASDLVVHEGMVAKQGFHATDPNHDPLDVVWHSDAIPDATGSTVFEWQTAVGDAGKHGPVVVSVTDGHFEVEATFWVTVLPYDPRAAPDADQDGVADDADNCPGIANRLQKDQDADGEGDACEALAAGPAPPPGQNAAMDTDQDGIADDADNCVAAPNPLQRDMDLDDEGDVCDADADGDHVHDRMDNCLGLPNPDQQDGDGDGVGDACQKSATPEDTVPQSKPAQALQTQRVREAPAALVGSLLLLGAAAAAVVVLLTVVLLRPRRR